MTSATKSQVCRSEMTDEVYLMKPKLLKLRTWVFHSFWEMNKGEITRQDAIGQALEFAMNELDDNIMPGQLSPAIFLFLALVPAVALMAWNVWVTISAEIALFAAIYSGFNANYHALFKFDRLITLPVRLLYGGVLWYYLEVEAMLLRGMWFQ